MDMKHTRHWLTMVVWLLCSITASAETVASGTCGDNLTWTLTDEGELIIEGTGAMTDYGSEGDVPWHDCKPSINDIIVKEGVISIGDYAFYECSNLTSITIPEDVTNIGFSAFEGCSNLTSVTIPESVTSISSCAFANCTGLTSITIPGCVVSIGNSTFFGCINLTSIIIPKSVRLFGNETAFYGCSSLVSINLPDEVTRIAPFSFYGCSSLVSINLPESVAEIGSFAFEGCTGLTSITSRATVPPVCDGNSFISIDKSIPVYVPASSVAAYQAADGWSEFTNIRSFIASGTCGENLTWTLTDEGELIIEGTGAMTDYDSSPFVYRSSIKNVTVKDGVTSIGAHAFESCTNLTYVTIPESVTSIGAQTFRGCCSLTSITFPKELVSIGEYAFDGCSNFTSITIPGGVTSIGSAAFKGCTGELVVNCNIPSTSAYASGAFAYSDFTKIIISEGVTSIGNYAFFGSNSLTSITIPKSVTEIGTEVFYECTGELIINCNIPSDSPYTGAFFNSDFTKATISDGVTSIGDYAFVLCDNLTSVTIPESVTEIGKSAFYDCSSLASIVIPTNVTSIGYEVFRGCSSLTSIIIPENVIEIGDYAFYECSGLTSITIPEGVTSIGEYAFRDCSSLTTINIPESVTKMGESVFWGCNSLTSFVIPEGVTEVGDNAFRDCTSLTSITISEESKLTSIGESSFSGCSSLTSINIPDCVTSIGVYAFSGCSSLASVAIPENVTTMGLSGIFSDCSSLVSAFIPEGVSVIGYRAFDGCGSLTSINIPESVTEIRSSAFEDCTSLTTITSKATTPPVCSDSTSFGFVDKSIPVYVPASSVAAYQATDGWSEFTNIRSYIASGTCGENLTWTLTDEGELIIEGTGAMTDYEEAGSEPWFYYSTSIEKIVIKNGVSSIGDKAFWGCSTLSSVVISESVISIGEYAFCGCDNLTSIIITKNVTNIGNRVFEGCDNLVSIVVEEGNTNFDSRNDCNAIIKTGTNTLIAGCSSTIIPENVTSIGYCAFLGCTNLTSIIIPKGVTNIEDCAFAYCSLTSVNIPEGITSLGRQVFHGCEFTSIIIPESVTSIGWYAFSQCKNLTSITISKNVKSIGQNAFQYCNSLTTITIPESVTSIGAYTFQYCDNLTSVTVENTVPVALTDSDVFTNRANATLYVPAGSKEAYASAAVWSEFKEIVEVGNAFVLDDATLRAGRSALLPVALTNENETTAFQCDIYLPEGITLQKTDKGKYDITLAEERKDDHTVTSSLQNDGAIRVVVASLTSSLFAGNSGDLFYLNLQADEDISGELPLSIKNIRISESDGTRHDLHDASCVINVPAFTPADANNDGLVAIDDVVLTINYLLGDVSDSFLFVAADMNADNQILIDDVVQIINCLLGVGTADVQDARSRMRETGEALTAGDTQCGFGVKLSNASNYVALQCDVLLPAGVDIDDVRVTSGGDHGVVFREMGDGQVRIAVTSLTNEAFASDNLLDVAVSADSQADIHITNAYAVTRGGVMVKAADASLTHGTTGIQPAGMKAISTEIYDLNGRVVKENTTSTEGLQKGIYLMNGKKIVVK